MRRFPFVAVALMLGMIAILGAPPCGVGAQTAVVKIGHTSAFTCGPMYIGQALGFFAEEGVKQELVNFQGGSGIVEACAAGAIDGGFVGTVPALYAMEAKVPLTFVADGKHMSDDNWDMALVVRNGLDVDDPSDLRGKTVAVNQRRTVYGVLLAAWLEKGGLTLKDVNLVELPLTQMEAALLRQSIDAAVTGEPYLTFTLDHKAGKLAATSQDMMPDMLIGLLAFSNSFLKKSPDVARRYVKAYVRAIQWIHANPDKARSMLVEFLGFGKDVAQTRLPDWYDDGHVDIAGFREVYERMKDLGLIEGPVDIEKFVDQSYLGI